MPMRVLRIIVVLYFGAFGIASARAVSAGALGGDSTAVVPTSSAPGANAPPSGAMMAEPDQNSTNVPPASPTGATQAQPVSPGVR